jgi:hypothetical protein
MSDSAHPQSSWQTPIPSGQAMPLMALNAAFQADLDSNDVSV